VIIVVQVKVGVLIKGVVMLREITAGGIIIAEKESIISLMIIIDVCIIEKIVRTNNTRVNKTIKIMPTTDRMQIATIFLQV
jgi:hypothetical protein